MASVVLCPNCGGQKTVSKPPYIAGDVNAWVGDTSLYPCPTCEGRGWIRVDSVPQVEFDCIKSVALSSMETAENLMDECTNRADRIKELEADLHHAVAGEHAADREIERLRAKIFDIESKNKELRDELNHSISENDAMFLNKMTWATCSGVTNAFIDDLLLERERDKPDVELLDEMLRIVNPLIKSGAYAKPSAESRLLATRMHGLCQTVVQFRRNHGIVG